MTAVRPSPLALKRVQFPPLECRALALFEEISALSLKQIAVALEISPQSARMLMHSLESLGDVVRKPPVVLRHRKNRTRYLFAGRIQA